MASEKQRENSTKTMEKEHTRGTNLGIKIGSLGTLLS